jgi:NOL1/NOP2/fmu family ribosome biogenesis protein
MLRRGYVPDAIASWEKFGNDACVKMQREILSSVDVLLKPGGILVYSTCTFSTSENEEMLQWFLNEHPSYEMMKIEETKEICHGLSHAESLTCAARIFPHRTDGEGHFCAKLRKKPDAESKHLPDIHENTDFSIAQSKSETIQHTRLSSTKKAKINQKKYTEDNYEFAKENFLQAFDEFSKDVLTTECAERIRYSSSRHLQIIQGHVYTLPESIPSFDGLKIAKKGLYLGNLKVKKSKIHFEPSHSFLISLNRPDLKKCLSFSTRDLMLQKYIKGETIFFPDANEAGNNGLIAETMNETCAFLPVCVQQFPIGWGKMMQGNMIKNLYPQGWRR